MLRRWERTVDKDITLERLIALACEQKSDLTVSFSTQRDEIISGEYEAEGIVDMTPPIVGSKPLYKGPTKTWGTYFRLQKSRDGRVWVCLNGLTVLRFKPVEDKRSIDKD